MAVELERSALELATLVDLDLRDFFEGEFHFVVNKENAAVPRLWHNEGCFVQYYSPHLSWLNFFVHRSAKTLVCDCPKYL